MNKALGMVLFHKLPGETIFNKSLCGDLVDSSGLADSRYDLEHTVGVGGRSCTQKLLTKVDAINVNFSTDKIVARMLVAPACADAVEVEVAYSACTS